MPQNRSSDSDTNGRNRLSRTESLKSERSDKRVSFNKDVGIKHIPRGAKATPVNKAGKPPTPVKVDEWAACSHVHREPVALKPDQLAEEAENIVRLIDNVNCNSLDRTSRGRNTTPKNNYAHHTYNNVLFNNNRNNRTNGENPRSRPKSLPTPRTTNPISRKLKGDVNREGNQAVNRKNSGDSFHQPRRRSADPVPESLTPKVSRQNAHLFGHKSVPDLSYLNNESRAGYGVPGSPAVINRANHTSVDNLHHDHPSHLNNRPKTSYKSVDNLSGRPQESNRLQGFKSVGHLPSTSFPENDGGDRMSRPTTYRPKVGNIIRKFNQDAEDVQRPNPVPDLDPGRRGTLEPDRFRNHNNNQPFSYTGSSPVVPMHTVRRLSPPRNLSRPTPPRDSPSPELPVYAQVNKPRGRDMERNFRNRSYHDAEYSAKIIITDDDYDEYGDHRIREDYREGDDDAYESYQVPEDNLRRLLSDNLHEYKEHSNNNINMSSIGVQTEGLSKNATRGRPKPQQKVPMTTPTRPYGQRQQEESRVNTSSYQTRQTREQRNDKQFHNNLTSASLVRQVNHGFGRTDRSPSPPPRAAANRAPRRNNVVPLLSDTSDSEAEHGRPRTVDPLARIRDQVMQREKLQEEEEQEEARYRRKGDQHRSVLPYSDEMTPLTIDEVDALSIVMDETGKKNLVVSNQAESSLQVTRTSNHRTRRTETYTDHSHHKHNESRTKERERERDKEKEKERERERERDIKKESQSLPRPRKASQERNNLPRDPTPPRRRSETPTRRDIPEKNTKKNNLEKEKKDKKEKEQKKKKKRIKIKFFYDPRPQDEPDVDPLSKFTEFRGDGSPDRQDRSSHERSPDERQHERSPPPNNRERRDDSYPRDSDNNRRDDSYPPNNRRDDGYPNERENGHYNYERYDYDKYQRRSQERDEYQTRNEYKERRVGSRERLDYDDNKRRDSKDSRDSRVRDESRSRSRDNLNRSRENLSRSRENLERSRDNLRSTNTLGRSKDNLNRSKENLRHSRENLRHSRENLRHSRENLRRSRESLDGSRDNVRRSRDNLDRYVDPSERRNDLKDDYYDGDSPDAGHGGRTLSEKYRSYDDPPPAQPDPPTEEEEKHDKIQRQRKKFFSVLMSDGRKGTKGPPEKQKEALKKVDKPKDDVVPPRPAKTNKAPRKRRPWPLSLLRARGPSNERGAKNPNAPPSAHYSRPSSRASSKASSRPSVRASKLRRDGPPSWESSTLARAELRSRQVGSGVAGPPPGGRGGEGSRQTTTTAGYSSLQRSPDRAKQPPVSKQRYFGDTDLESERGVMGPKSRPGPPYHKKPGPSGPAPSRSAQPGDYRSLPNRGAKRSGGKRVVGANRGRSPGGSLHSSESEVDSRASHVSTGSNRSVYLHATAVADIPGRRGSDASRSNANGGGGGGGGGEADSTTPSERTSAAATRRETKRVNRSFSLLAPWKPRHYREKFEVEYDNREAREGKGALPPRPPRRPAPQEKTGSRSGGGGGGSSGGDARKVNRSQSVYKDSKLATWLRRRRNKEAKGI